MKNLFTLCLPFIALLAACNNKAQNTPKQKLSLQEIQNLLQGTWAPISYDTIPYLYETYDKSKIHYTVKYPKDSAYLKTINSSPNYYLSYQCPPDSINDMGNEQGAIHQRDSIHGVYILTQRDYTRKVIVLIIEKITKDTLIESDGEDAFISIKMH